MTHFPKDQISPEEWSVREWLNYLIFPKEDGATIYSRNTSSLERWCDAAGITFENTSIEIDPALQCDPGDSRLAQLPIELLAICSRPCPCQIQVDDDTDVPWLCSRIADAFPEANTLFLFATKQEALEFGKVLADLTQRPIGQIFGGGRRLWSRLTVGTFQAGIRGTFDYKTPVCVVIPRWPGSMHRYLKRLTLQPWMQRLYLIRTPSDRLSPRDEFELRHRIGPCVSHDLVPKTRHVFHEIRFGGQGTGGFRVKTRTFLNKHKLYWTHDSRNRVIARTACEFQKMPRDGESARPRVAVIVEVTKHLEAFREILKDWPRLTQDSEALNPLPPFSVITLSALSRTNSPLPEVLINACGGLPSPTLQRLIRQCGIDRQPVCVVDYSDGFDPVTARLARRRQRAYRSWGADYRPIEKAVIRRIFSSR